MIKGHINNEYEPVVEIDIPSRNPKKVTAVIDTGFNGYISVPEFIIKATDWQFIGYDKYELASGAILRERVYLGDVVFDGKWQKVYALANKTKDILLGTRLFNNKTLTIDFGSKTVKIQ